ncbi:alpha/beta fold hydrolase [Anianabacter salinae]|uniref:alpha/beta fold hydrolase n=1 Tax=Anianabacter salinae TaxID=2851023 RepID=UPI00225E20AF|nr:alpha/beta hydrolase [Anianabacter salinae]MBV0912710.1 alpha/beta hydrolase [Anianabacter salinae]
MPTYESADGLTLHYLDEGEGRPVLCLPGLTRNASDFDYLAPYLPDVRLIRPDYRGRGKSDWADPETYTVPVEARDIVSLLDHLGLDSAAVIGTSRGGIIAMMLAATSKARLQGVCLNDIGPVIDQAGLDRISSYVGQRPRAATRSELAAALPGAFPDFEGVPDSRWAEEAARHTVETDTGLNINYDPRLKDAFDVANAAGPVDLWPLFDAMDGLPLAVIRGANSDLLSPATVEEMCRRRPDLIQAEVPGRGHIPFLDEPEAIETIRSWLAGL